MSSSARAPVASVKTSSGHRFLGITFNHGSNMIFLTQVALFCLYGGCTTFAPGFSVDQPTGSNLNIGDITIHIFIGLFVFLGLGFAFNQSSRYSWQAAGYSLAIGTTAVEWAMLLLGFWDLGKQTRSSNLSDWPPIPLDLTYLTNALYIAATVLISYSAMIGRVSFGQAYAIAFFEVFFATANYIIAIEIEVLDAGGTFFVHTFGAAFGLFASVAICNKLSTEVTNQARGKTAGALAFLGLAVLFVTLPVFNIGNIGYLVDRITATPGAANTVGMSLVFRGYFNTVVAMASSIAAVFAISKANSASAKAFNVWQIQTAALAGGAAVGATGVYLRNAYGALMLGAVAGAFAVLAQTVATPALAKLRFQDTNGVLAGHLVPGLIGGLSSAIAAARARASQDFAPEVLNVLIFDNRSALWQGGYQLAYCIISLAFGMLAGLVTGAVVNLVLFEPKAVVNANDADEWEGIEDGNHHTVAAAPEEISKAPAAAADATPEQVLPVVAASL